MSIKKKLLIPGLLFLLLIIGIFVSSTLILREQKSDGLIINLAGRQRMLTQKMTKELLMFYMDIADPKLVLNTVEVFDRTLKALRNGGEAPLDLEMKKFGMIPPPKDESVIKQLDTVISLWKPFKKAVINYLSNRDRESMNYILNSNVKLLSEMNKAVFLMQKVADSKVKKMGYIQVASIIIGIIIVSFFIMVSREITSNVIKISEALGSIAEGNLTATVEINSKDELGFTARKLNEMVSNLDDVIGNFYVATHNFHRQADLSSFYSKAFSREMNMAKDVSSKVKRNTKTLIERIGDAGREAGIIRDMASSIKESVGDMESSAMKTSEIVSDLIEIISKVIDLLQKLTGGIAEFANGISVIDSASESVREAGRMVLDRIRETAQAIEEISSAIEEVSSAINQQSASIEEVANNAKEAERVGDEVVEKAIKGKEKLNVLVDSIKSIREKVEGLGRTMMGLSKAAQDIGNITDVIQEISEQTNLLALNAAIEAARAGEHGKGFAVVADEIRKLAERSAASTKEISELIKNIQDEVEKANQDMKKGAERAEEMAGLADEATTAMDEIVDASNNSKSFIAQITNATAEQAEVSLQITKRVESIKERAESIVSIMDSLKSSGEGMIEKGENLKSLTEQMMELSKKQEEATTKVMDMAKSMEMGSEEARRCIEDQIKSVKEVVENVVKIADSVEELFSLLNECMNMAKATEDSMADMDKLDEQTGKMTSKLMGIMDALGENSLALRKNIAEKFRLKDYHVINSLSGIHRLYVAKVKVCLEENMPEVFEKVDYSSCEFGKWYYNEGKRRFGRLDIFRELEEPHRALHEDIEKAVELALKGDREGIKGILSDIESTADKIEELIKELARISKSEASLPTVLG